MELLNRALRGEHFGSDFTNSSTTQICLCGLTISRKSCGSCMAMTHNFKNTGEAKQNPTGPVFTKLFNHCASMRYCHILFTQSTTESIRHTQWTTSCILQMKIEIRTSYRISEVLVQKPSRSHEALSRSRNTRPLYQSAYGRQRLDLLSRLSPSAFCYRKCQNTQSVCKCLSLPSSEEPWLRKSCPPGWFVRCRSSMQVTRRLTDKPLIQS